MHVKVVEGNKERVQVFQGNVIARQGSGVARDLHGPQGQLRRRRRAHVPGHTPIVAKIEVVKRGDVRRAKLYYLRDRVGKAAKIREKRDALSVRVPSV